MRQMSHEEKNALIQKLAKILKKIMAKLTDHELIDECRSIIAEVESPEDNIEQARRQVDL